MQSSQPRYPRIHRPSSKSAHTGHQSSPSQQRKIGMHSLLAIERLVALLRQKVLGKQLNHASKEQQATRDGVHKPYHEQPRLAHGIVEAVDNQADGLPKRRRGPE